MSLRPFEDEEEDAFVARDHPRQLPGTGLAMATMVLLGVNVCVDLGAIAINAVQLQPAAALGPKPVQAQRDDDLAELFANPMACMQPLVLLPTAIVFLIWLHRAYSNLSLFRVSGLEYSPGWAVGYFFIPILNLFRPYQVTQEMWRASDPEVSPDDRRAWRDGARSPTITLWWAAWLISGFVNQISARMALSGAADDNAGKVIDIFGDGLSIFAALFAIMMISQLRNRQARRYQRILYYRSELK